MEVSDIVLALVSILSAITGGVVKSIMKDIKDLEHSMNTCQSDLPKEFVMKSDYKDDIKEVKAMLGELFTLVRDNKK
jgi:predicted urease superfamily metal-dependent hydrolase